MELASGVPLESPAVVVPWGVSERELLALLPDALRLREDDWTGSAFGAEVVWLGGLAGRVSFFLKPRGGDGTGALSGVQMSWGDRRMDEEFREVQSRVESVLGPPTATRPGSLNGWHPDHDWDLPGAKVQHRVIDGSRIAHILSVEPK